MEKATNNLGIFEKSWIAANAYDKSNQIARLGGIVDTENVMTLSSYLKAHPIESAGIDYDTKDSEKLETVYVIPITVTKIGAAGDSVEVNLIIDSKYKDVAVMYKDEEGATKSFELDGKLKDNINDKTKMLKDVVSPEKIRKEFLPENLKELTEKLAKGENLEPKTKDEVIRRGNKVNGTNLTKEELMEEKNGKEEQDEEEKKEAIMEKMPAKDRDKILEICEKSGMDVADLKQSITVKNPKSVTNLIEGESLSPTGGEVTILKFRNKEANAGSDEIVMAQGDRVEKRDKYNEPISKYMNEKSKSNTTIDSLEDNETMIEYQDENGEVVRENLNGVPSDISENRKDEFTRKFNDIMEKRTENIESVKSSNAENKEESLVDIENGTYKRVTSLMNEYGIELPKTTAELEDKNIKTTEGEEEEQDPHSRGAGPWDVN